MPLTIYCCGCEREVEARCTNGGEIYPGRNDLYRLFFWKCDACGNYVGCHKTPPGQTPLGNIPTPEIRSARSKIHTHMDPIWKLKWKKRGYVYGRLSKKLGREYHTGELRTIEECREVYKELNEIWREIKAEVRAQAGMKE